MIQGFRLSPHQRRIFLLQQPESPGYGAQCTVEIGGELAPDLLRRATERTVERHQILRTVFRRSPGLKVPLQVIEESQPPLWRCVDLSGLEASMQEPRLGSLLAEEERRPFDLANGPVLRATLSILRRDRHVLHLSLPAQCADAHSLRLLVREIGRSYFEILAGKELAGGDDVVQYVQFSEWQNEALAEGVDPGGERFWSDQGISEVPDLALPFMRDLAGGTDGAEPLSTSLILDRDLTARIAVAADRLEASFAGFLLAGWLALLCRLSGQPEIVMAFLGDGRKYEELREVLGLFSRWLPVRCRCTEDLPFRECLRQVERGVGEASEWQECLAWNQGDEEGEARPFAVGFDYEELSSEEVAGNLRLRIAQQSVAIDRLRLRLSCARLEGRVVARFEFTPHLFAREDVERLAERYRALLASAVETPEAATGELEILGAAERQRLLVDLNRTDRPDFEPRCLHHWIEEQAARTPDRIAVVAPGSTLSFAQLDARAGLLALRLRALGVAADHRVAIFLERSPEMVVGLLAALKAGGAYLPLDLAHPPARLSGILADAGVTVVLTRSGLADRVPPGAPPVLLIDADAVPAPGETVVAAGQDPETLAYVIYTSGSTGTPKGVMIPHRAAVNYLAWAQEAYAVEAGAGAPVHSPLAFDLTVTSLLAPLVAGRQVELVPEEQGIEGLSNALRQGGGFSLVKITPAHLHALRQLLPPGEAAGRAAVLVIGGEPLSGESLDFWGTHAAETRLVNEYGPTEATVGCCVYQVPDGPVPAGPLPIGLPIANTRVYLVSSRLRPVPLGVPGELLVGGAGLARGYLNRPDLTAERFIPDPFGSEPGGRLYRTGDLARHRPDGQIEFLGRIDHQVKVRGFRIELEEISAVLVQHHGVRESVAAVHQDAQGDRRLVAYWVPAGAAAPNESELRSFLHERLPDYMVPALLVELRKLPLTPNGKVDRAALPLPGPANRPGQEGSPLPRTMTEEMLAEIWAKVLGVEQVRVGESFFDLGGHSLLAAQLVSRIRQVFGIEISLRQLFDAPTVASLGEVLKAGIRNRDVPEAPPLVPVPREGPFPLSFAQQRLWLIDQLQPGSPAYNLPSAFRLLGPLAVTALERTGDEIVRRHEVLRTTFAPAGGQPLQVIAAPRPLPLPRIDLRALPAERREQELRLLAGEEAARPFDLLRGPLFRAALVYLDKDEHAVFLNQHHIVSDGWSQGILIREVEALYNAFASGRPSPLAPLPIQYADFSHWQRRWLEGDALESRLAYWKQQLSGVARLSLPTDRPAPAVQTFRGRSLPLRLGRDLAASLRALGRRYGSTLFMTLLAAFQALLQRHSGQSDIVVGTTIAGRDRVEIEPLIGFFVNALAVRTDLSGNPGFPDLLVRVRNVILEAAAYQDVPFERLVESLEVKRDMSSHPIFQVVFTLENVAASSPEMLGLKLRPLGFEGSTAKFALTTLLQESALGLGGMLEYNTDLFDATTIVRLAEHYRVLLGAIARSPETALGELPILAESERHQFLHEWNDTGSVFPAARLESLFEAQAARTPEALAVLSTDEQISYRELDILANRLAHHLQALGIGPGGLVAVAMPRGVSMLVAVLGILKAGAAYVPLDASFPLKRMAWILSSLAVPCLLTRGSRLELAMELARESSLRHVVCLDPAADVPVGRTEDLPEGTLLWTATDLALRPEESPVPLAGPEAIAYVIFTSGSTGTPKGVVVCHRPVANLIHWVHRAFGFGPADRVLFVTSLAFDLSVYDIFGLLAAGGSIWVASEEEVREPQLLVRLLRGHGITYWDSAPAALQQLAPFFPEGASEEESPGPRLVFLSGDWIPVKLPDRVRAAYPEARVISLGGATEATVWSNFFPIGEVAPHWVSIPYGRPIQNARYYVLDERLDPCPIGAAGDLFIGGQCLASGYAAEPLLTAQKFIPDPFGGDPGARLYRTGDRARFWNDGNLQFLGRLDHQVKIRGFRIELGEIATVLGQHPSVGECLVMVREEVAGDKRLVAYVIPAPGEEMETDGLKVWLRERLPEPMVPAAFVALSSWPTTSNGKLDRAALPAPEEAAPAGESFVAPRTQIEEMLAGIWSEVLGRPSVGARDDFFELGGHSLLATQIVSRVRRSFEVEIPLRTVFEAPTLGELAERIAHAARGAGPELPPLVPVPRQSALPLSFAQQRLWLIHQLDPRSPAYNIPVGSRLSGPLDLPALTAALGEVVARHESLRTRFVMVDGEPAQVISPACAFTLPRLDLSALEEESRWATAQALARDEAQRPFDLSSGALFRVSLLQLDAEDHVLLATMHHTISDGWSMLVFVRELTALYAARSTGTPARLPELPIQYVDFAAWQRHWLRGEVLAAELDYWRRRLHGAPALLDLPTDRPRPAVQSHQGAHRDFALSSELSGEIVSLARRRGVTLFMTLLGAFQALLSRYSGQDDVCVGTPIAGRNRIETEGLIGFFVNTLVLRADLAGDPSFSALLDQVRRVSLEAYAHQDLPFEKLVEELRPERSLSHTPLFQVLFALQNAAPGEGGPSGLTLSSFDSDTGVAKFDLALRMADRGGDLHGTLEHRADLFQSPTIDRMISHLQRLLSGAVADPERPMSSIPLLAPAELRQLLSDWRGEETGAPAPCLHELFEAQVKRDPGAVALIYETESVSYADLNRRSNQLARYLRRRSIGAGDLVAIGLERSPDMVVAVLGVLKAGASYVALDPGYPRARRDHVLRETSCRLYLTQESLLDEPVSSTPVVCLERIGTELSAEEPCDLVPLAGPGDLAYVVYTSGSTGLPKGILAHHRGAAGYLSFIIRRYGIGPADTALQLAGLAFDASVRDLLGPLAAGARVVIVAPGEARDPQALLARIEQSSVTCLPSIVPSLLQQLSETAVSQGRVYRTVRLILTSGEALRLADCAQARVAFGANVQVVNQYGPTECTMTSTYHPVRSDEAGETAGLGRPVAGAGIRLLDRHLEPVGAGIPGELCISGGGLAFGYLGYPDRTASVFIPDALGGVPGARLYRTGDLARFRADGSLELLGRIDHQVKIRGFRVEPEEVEAVLGGHPRIRAAAVVARGQGAERSLAAYFVPGQEIEAGDLRAFLRASLPEYMVPTAFVQLAALPLTPNGKIDRRALPEPDRKTADDPGAVAPRTPTEGVIAAIWSTLLDRPHLGVHDNFFELGGHSLLAMRAINRIRQALSVDLPLRALFEAATIADLADRVEGLRATGLSGEPDAIVVLSRNGRSFPASFAQERLWLQQQVEPGSGNYNMFMPVLLEGSLKVAALKESLDEIVRRHEVLRTTFAVDDQGSVVQIIAPRLPIDLSLVDLGSLLPDDRERLARQLAQAEAVTAFDLARDPMLRCHLICLDPERHVLFLNLHHIAGDRWSIGLLVRELVALYRAFSAGAASPLADLPIQYADYAAWQRQRLRGEVLRRGIDFWRRQLAGARELELPTDRPRPAAPSLRAAHASFHFPPELARKLKTLGERAGSTLFMTLLAGFQALLGRLAGQTDVVVGIESANRDRVETESLIGFLVNQLAVRVDVGRDASFRELLGRTRHAVLDAYSHQDIPFQMVVSMLQPERAAGRIPFIRVIFNFEALAETESTSRAVPALPGLKLGELPVDGSLARFDLTLRMAETRDGLVGDMEYSTDLFDAATVHRMNASFRTLLENAVEQPEAPLEEIEMTPEDERLRRAEIKAGRREAHRSRLRRGARPSFSLEEVEE